MQLLNIVKYVVAAVVATAQVNAIYFGTATDNPSNFGNIVPSSFNLLVAENAMKWSSMESSQGNVNYGTTRNLLNYCTSNGMKLRGHTFVWHAQAPSYVNNLSGSQLEAAIDNRIKGIFANIDHSNIIAWDVVNEAIADGGSSQMRSSFLTQKMGNNFVETVFRIARKYAPPNVKLFYNDYNCEVYNTQKTNRCYDLVKGLADKGLVDGMGFQMHLSLQYGENSQMGGVNQTFKRYTDLGLEVHVTEMDVGIANASGSESDRFQTQANWYKTIAGYCVANPKCTAFVVWGVTDNTSWRADGKPLLFDANRQKKPAYDAVVNTLKSAPPPTPPPTTPRPTPPPTPPPTTPRPTPPPTPPPTTPRPTPPPTPPTTPGPKKTGIVCNFEGEILELCKLTNDWGFESGTVCVGITTCVTQSPPYGVIART